MTGVNLHRQTVIAANQDCPPCTGQCGRGRMCPANAPAEACTDIQGSEPRTSRRARAIFWSIYLLFLGVFLGGLLAAIFRH